MKQPIVFPPPPPPRIKEPTRAQYKPDCEGMMVCLTGAPWCGCWNEFAMIEHYSQPKFYSAKAGEFPI